MRIIPKNNHINNIHTTNFPFHFTPLSPSTSNTLPCADKTPKIFYIFFLYNPYLTKLFYLVSKDFS